MPVDWKDPEAYNRLFAAMLAANDLKPFNYALIASYYGNGATYDAIEGRFRNFRKVAKVLHEEIASGRREPLSRARGSGPASGGVATTPRKRDDQNGKVTPKKEKGDKVVSGRVGKSPLKKNGNGTTANGNGNSNGAVSSFATSIKSEPGTGEVSFGLMSNGGGQTNMEEDRGRESHSMDWLDGASGNGKGGKSYDGAEDDFFQGLEGGV